MKRVLQCNGARIDDLSQQILILLADVDEPLTNGEIKNELSEPRDSVHYRLNTHLVPADLVSRDEPESTLDNGPVYTLTTSGMMWVASKRAKFEQPKRLSAVSVTAFEAKKEAESAKNSVQSYRKDLWKQGNELDELQEELDELQENSASGVTRKELVNFVDKRAAEIRQDLDARTSRIERQIDEINERIGDIEETLGQLNRRVNTNTENIERLLEGLEDADDAFRHLQNRVDDLEKKTDSRRI